MVRRVRPLKRWVISKKCFPIGMADLSVQCFPTKSSKYTKYSFGFVARLELKSLAPDRKSFFRNAPNEWLSKESNQGGTVEYFCIPPLIFRGWGIFYTLPNSRSAECRVLNAE